MFADLIDARRPNRSEALKDAERTGGYLAVAKMTWKTSAIDVAVGVTASFAVAPLVAIVDAAIIDSVNGSRTPVLRGIINGYKKLFLTPHKFITDPYWRKVTGLCWMVFAGTYASSNLTQSYIDANSLDKNESKLLKVGTVSVFNIGLNMFKDILIIGVIRELAMQAGNTSDGGKKAKVPLRSRLCFNVRDVMTMLAAFAFAEAFGEYIARKTKGTLEPKTAGIVANIALPAGIQPISTVVHLYALNYAEAQRPRGWAMAKEIWAKYPSATVSRIARILPAFGLGNSINIEWRDRCLREAERRRWL